MRPTSTGLLPPEAALWPADGCWACLLCLKLFLRALPLCLSRGKGLQALEEGTRDLNFHRLEMTLSIIVPNSFPACFLGKSLSSGLTPWGVGSVCMGVCGGGVAWTAALLCCSFC